MEFESEIEFGKVKMHLTFFFSRIADGKPEIVGLWEQIAILLTNDEIQIFGISSKNSNPVIRTVVLDHRFCLHLHRFLCWHQILL